MRQVRTTFDGFQCPHIGSVTTCDNLQGHDLRIEQHFKCFKHRVKTVAMQTSTTWSNAVHNMKFLSRYKMNCVCRELVIFRVARGWIQCCCHIYPKHHHSALSQKMCLTLGPSSIFFVSGQKSRKCVGAIDDCSHMPGHNVAIPSYILYLGKKCQTSIPCQHFTKHSL